MNAITLYVSHIVGADRQAEGCIWVQCNYPTLENDASGRPVEVTRELTVQVDRHSVAVFEERAPGGTPRDVLVSTTLVDATRRLFNMVGVA